MDSLNSGKYAYLKQLSTEQLEEILCAHIEDSEDKAADEEAVEYILEIIEKREKEHPTGRLFDSDQAWSDFQSHYNTEEGEGRSLYAVSHTLEKGHHLSLSQPAFSTELCRFRIALFVAVLLLALLLPSLFGFSNMSQILIHWTSMPVYTSNADMESFVQPLNCELSRFVFH